MREDGVLYLYQIFYQPRDYPNHYVVRRFAIRRGSPDAIPDAQPWAVVDTLDEARETVPFEADFRMPREEHDDRGIVETWV